MNRKRFQRIMEDLSEDYQVETELSLTERAISGVVGELVRLEMHRYWEDDFDEFSLAAKRKLNEDALRAAIALLCPRVEP